MSSTVQQLDPRSLLFPVTNPPPTSWVDVSLVHGRFSRHWGLIRGLQVEEKKRRKNLALPNARLTATLLREAITRLSLSLEAVDTKDKYNKTPGVGQMVHKAGEQYLRAQVSARNEMHAPPTKGFAGAAAAILVAMSREAEKKALAATSTDPESANAAWFSEGEIRELAAPLTEEDLTQGGDELVLGELENFGWGSMSYLSNPAKFGCVRVKPVNEAAAIATLEYPRKSRVQMNNTARPSFSACTKMGRLPVCCIAGCTVHASRTSQDHGDKAKLDAIFKTLYCKEHYEEHVRCTRGSKRRRRATSQRSPRFENEAVEEVTAATEMTGEGAGAASSRSSGKIKADWFRRALGEALLRDKLDQIERVRGVDFLRRIEDTWRRDFAKRSQLTYALTTNGEWLARKLEKVLEPSGGKGGGGAATASPILNRASYASCSERDGGGGGGTAASPHNGHSPLAPTRAGGAAKPGVRLLIDNREKRGATRNSQLSDLTNFLAGRRVPYEVRECKCGDYAWVVQPDAGKTIVGEAGAMDVGFEREYLVPRLLERKRVDDLAESMKDGRLERQKKGMLRARDGGAVSSLEIHVEGGTADARYGDEIRRRGLVPADLDAALDRSAGEGFKVVHHANFSSFSAYLADATQELQQEFEADHLAYEGFCTWQDFMRLCRGREPLPPARSAATAGVASTARAPSGAARRGANSGHRASSHRPPLAPVPARLPLPPGMSGLRKRTLDDALGIARRAGVPSRDENCSGAGDWNVVASKGDGCRDLGEESVSSHRGIGKAQEVDLRDDVEDSVPGTTGSEESRRPSSPGVLSDSSSDGCSVLEVRPGGLDSAGGISPTRSASASATTTAIGKATSFGEQSVPRVRGSSGVGDVFEEKGMGSASPLREGGDKKGKRARGGDWCSTAGEKDLGGAGGSRRPGRVRKVRSLLFAAHDDDAAQDDEFDIESYCRLKDDRQSEKSSRMEKEDEGNGTEGGLPGTARGSSPRPQVSRPLDGVIDISGAETWSPTRQERRAGGDGSDPIPGNRSERSAAASSPGTCAKGNSAVKVGRVGLSSSSLSSSSSLPSGSTKDLVDLSVDSPSPPRTRHGRT